MSKESDSTEYLVELAEKTGVACATVSDGHVLIFMKEHLQLLLKQIEERGVDRCIVMVKRPDFQN